MKRVPIYPPEIEDLNGQKTISYFVGKSESLTPAMDWLKSHAVKTVIKRVKRTAYTLIKDVLPVVYSVLITGL